MPSGILKNVKVAGIACAVPENKVEYTKYFDRFGEKPVKKFVKMSGVKERYVAKSNQTSSDLAYVAAEKLLDKLKWERDTIDGIIFITQSPDYPIPATACVLHKRLKLKDDCIAFDVNLGCSGYAYGVHMVASYMQCEGIKRMLLLVGDTSNKVISEEDKSSSMLFGEGGSATAFERDTSAKEIKFSLYSRGDGFKNIITYSGGFRNPDGKRERYEWGEGIVHSDFEMNMDGANIFTFSIDTVPEAINDFKKKFGVKNEDVDMYALHQANAFMLKTIASRADIPTDKMPVSIDRYGNTSVTSIPITICDACEKIEENKNLDIVCVGFGIGLSWGVVTMNVDSEMCISIEHTSEYYKDGGIEKND